MSDVIGIDFGTTNSLITFVDESGVRSFLTDSDRPHPSMVCYSGSAPICGTDAKRRFEGQLHSESEGIVRSPKRLLGTGTHYVLGREMAPAAVIADLMKFLREDAESRRGGKTFNKAVVSIPVGLDGRCRRELRDALMQAEINVVQFVHEPLAALYAFFRAREGRSRSYEGLVGELALVFDWGGGTLDLTLCQLGAASLTQVANFGDNEVGGDYIDEALMRYVIDKEASAQSAETFQARQEAPGARARLLEACEQAKIILSSRNSHLIYIEGFFFGGPEDNDFECLLRRDEFDEVARTFVERGLKAVDHVLARLNIDRRRVALCIATGGMVNIPAIADRLTQIFGSDRLHISSRGDRIISEGCAWIAFDHTQLRLAKPVEVQEARESFFSIFKAGDFLPDEGDVIPAELSMYCVDPSDGVAKIKLARPRQLGKVSAHDPRDNYAVLAVRVEPAAEPFMERISLNFAIDHDLILKVIAESQLLGDHDQAEIFDIEFSLDASPLRSHGGVEDTSVSEPGEIIIPAHPGEVRARSNVATRVAWELVPGEILYKFKKILFDRRNPRPLPEIVQKERLFYERCSVCGLRSHDPACKCASYT